MADFAQMLYGTAQNAAQDQGKGLPEAVQHGAQLALQAQQLQAKRDEIDAQKKQVAETKISKLFDYIKDAKNFKSPAARNNYIKSALGYRNALGIDPNAISDDSIKTLGFDENMGRMAALDLEIRAGRMSAPEALKIATDPQALAKIVPLPDAGAYDADFSEAQKEFLNRQSEEKKARTMAGQKDIGNTQELRKELTSHPVSKSSFIINASYDRVKDSLGGDSSAAGDLKGIYSYMKMLDDGSTVREGEFATAENARGVSEAIRGQYNKLLKGERLSPDQRKDFLKQARDIYNSQIKAQKGVNKQFEKIAKEQGMKPQQIFAGTDSREADNGQIVKLGNGKSYSANDLQGLLKKGVKSPKLKSEIEAALKSLGGQ